MAPQTPTGTTEIDVPSFGIIKGLRFEDGTQQFCGIPYADLLKRWSRAILRTSLIDNYHDGTQQGSICPQPPEYTVGEDYMVPVKRFPHFKDPIEVEFDSLNLNVVAPPKSDSGPCPVMVWIHGSAFIFGSSTHPAYDMVNLVSYSSKRGTPIIGVSINYRVGLFGFLASAAIKDGLARDGFHGAGNFGLTDQQTALQWVQKHISAFGGDPNNAPCYYLCMSGNQHTFPIWSMEQHEKRWEALLDHFGIPLSAPDSLERLRSLSQETIAAATCPIEGTVDATGNLCDDGWFYNSTPSLKNYSSPPKWLKAYMIGNVKHEGIIFTQNLSTQTHDTVNERMSRFLRKSDVQLVLSKYDIYPHTPDDEGRSRLEGMTADALFGFLDRKHIQASQIPTFAYHFDQQSTLDNPYKGLAYHAIDLLYVFMNLSERMTDGQEQLARKVAGDYLDFACGKEPWEPHGISGRWMRYGPNDTCSVITETEDEPVRKYSRMDDFSAAGIFENWVIAMDDLANVRWLLGSRSKTLL